MPYGYPDQTFPPGGTARRPGPVDRHIADPQDAPHPGGYPPAPSRRAAPAVHRSRLVLDQVQVSTLGLEATVEVRLTSVDGTAVGVATGPAVDGYVLRLAAVAAANALDKVLGACGVASVRETRCFIEHAGVVPFGTCEVAIAVVLLVSNGLVEQLTGSALVSGDPRQAVVRATLDAVNRRLEALLD